MEKKKVWWSLSLGLLLIFGYGMVGSGYGEEGTSGKETRIFSDNALFNGGFEGIDENKQFKGWTITLDNKKPDLCVVEVDTSVKHLGKSSLKVTVREETEDVTVTVKSLPFEAKPNKLYRVTGWVRHEGFVKEREVGYESISLRSPWDSDVWRFHTNTTSNFDWIFVEKLIGPTTNEKEISLSLMLHVYKGKPVVWFDDFRVQEYNPPPVPVKPKAWAYPVRANNALFGNVVDDPDGTEGKAFKVTTIDGVNNKIYGATISDQPAGLYRAVFRLKVADNSSSDILCQLGMVIIQGSVFYGANRVLRPNDFNEANKYQDFTLDFILPGKGLNPSCVYGIFGAKDWTDSWIDKVTITQLLEFTDDTMAKLYGD